MVSEELKQRLGSPLRAVESLTLKGGGLQPPLRSCPRLKPRVHRLPAAVEKSGIEVNKGNVLS